MRKILRLVFVLALVAAGGWYYVVQSRPVALVLTGIVTGHDVVDQRRRSPDGWRRCTPGKATP